MNAALQRVAVPLASLGRMALGRVSAVPRATYRRAWLAAVELCGMALAAAGIALVSLPAAFIAAGLALVTVAEVRS